MCGIVAFSGSSPHASLRVLDALRSLEYRGYDSWGIASKDKALEAVKAVGKISAVKPEDIVSLKGRMAIGHTRWATHGGVTEDNAHPQWNSDKTIAVVHNGIIENHEELRSFLREESGVPDEKRYRSQTDTEVIAHLIDHVLKKTHSPEDAFVGAVKMLKGRFTVVALLRDGAEIFAARDGSPLVVGISAEGFCLASDQVALLPYAREIHHVSDREYVVMGQDQYLVRSIDTRKRSTSAPEPVIDRGREKVGKEGYPHFMIKEIMEARHVIDDALRETDEHLLDIGKFLSGKTLFLTGCGTAGKMALLGQYLFAQVGKVSAQSFVASEYPLYDSRIDKHAVVIAISQSGETADVLECLTDAKKKGAKILSILNARGTTMERMSDKVMFLGCGQERAVASTKAAIGQMTILTLLAYLLGKDAPEGKKVLRHAQDKVRSWLSGELPAEMRRIAGLFIKDEHCYIVGRGVHAVIAQESAIKIQEVSYLHAEGFAAGELKHGPLALIAPGTKCIAFVPPDGTRADMEGTVSELKARGAWVLGLSRTPHKDFDEWVEIPDIGVAEPIASIIPIQLLAYHLGVIRGFDPDMPRNLAKSVTVK
jgi:glucosamine--fructose-6-phosphate aminotransferase (isomerizing)